MAEGQGRTQPTTRLRFQAGHCATTTGTSDSGPFTFATFFQYSSNDVPSREPATQFYSPFLVRPASASGSRERTRAVLQKGRQIRRQFAHSRFCLWFECRTRPKAFQMGAPLNMPDRRIPPISKRDPRRISKQFQPPEGDTFRATTYKLCHLRAPPGIYIETRRIGPATLQPTSMFRFINSHPPGLVVKNRPGFMRHGSGRNCPQGWRNAIPIGEIPRLRREVPICVGRRSKPQERRSCGEK